MEKVTIQKQADVFNLYSLCRAPGLVMVHCSRSDVAAELSSDPQLQELVLQYS